MTTPRRQAARAGGAETERTSAPALAVDQAVRLACLKVAHHVDADADEVVKRAQVYAEFVLGQGGAAKGRATSGNRIVKDSEISDAL